MKYGWDKEGKYYQCSDGLHSSWWMALVQTDEWKAWYEHASRNLLFDVDESQESGQMSYAHACEFLKFVRTRYQKKRGKPQDK